MQESKDSSLRHLTKIIKDSQNKSPTYALLFGTLDPWSEARQTTRRVMLKRAPKAQQLKVRLLVLQLGPGLCAAACSQALETPNRQPPKYSRSMVGISLLCSWGSLFGAPTRVPSKARKGAPLLLAFVDWSVEVHTLTLSPITFPRAPNGKHTTDFWGLKYRNGTYSWLRGAQRRKWELKNCDAQNSLTLRTPALENNS